MGGRSLGFAGMVALVGLIALPAWQPAQGDVLLGHPSKIAQTQTVRIAIDPATKTAVAGEVFTVNIRVDAGTQTVDAVDAFLDFNRGVLRIVDTAGNETNTVAPGTSLPAVLVNTADNALGQITYRAGRQPAGQAPSGAFVLATLRFMAVAGGTGAITFVSQPPSRDTNAYFEGVSVLAGASDGTVTITIGPTPTAGASPSVTPTATVTPIPQPPGGGGGGGGGGGAPTPTPTRTSTPTPTATPTSAATAAAPAIVGPAEAALVADLAPALSWTNPPATTQYHIQVLPAANAFTSQPDGPGIELIIADQALVQQARYQVRAPQLGVGDYVVLPGMTYTWRVRTASAQEALIPTDPRWGPWSSRTFRTPLPSSATITPAGPAGGSTVESLTPTLRWTNTDSRVFYYEVQLSKDPAFNTDPRSATAAVFWEVRHGGESNPMNSYAVRPQFALESATAYFWRVRPRTQGDAPSEGVAWSATWSFRTP